LNKKLPSPRSTDESDPYFLNVDIYDYDETIVAHPYMDQIKASIVERVIACRESLGRPVRVLDLGCGSGQLARVLLGLTDVELELCDTDAASEEFCKHHPELQQLEFHRLNVLHQGDAELLAARKYDIIIALGVLHHVPPLLRSEFARACRQIAPIVVIADEGLAEYGNEDERRQFGAVWYDFVINEAERRGIHKLARLERLFKKSDISAVRSVTDDYKVSISETENMIRSGGLAVTLVRRFGDWSANKGGMFLIEAA
jgi:SAM-dependent methyltransferase